MLCVCVCAKLLQSRLTLCSPMDCSPPGSSVHGILQARTHRSGLLCPPPGHLPNAGIKPESLASPTLAGGFFTISTTWEAHVTADSSSIQAQISRVCFFHFLVRILWQVELILNKCDAFLLLIWIWKFKAGKDSSCLCLAGPYRRKEKSPIWFWTGMHGV